MIVKAKEEWDDKLEDSYSPHLTDGRVVLCCGVHRCALWPASLQH